MLICCYLHIVLIKLIVLVMILIYWQSQCCFGFCYCIALIRSCIFPFQNKILHNRLEALHIKLAEKDRNSVGISSSSGPDALGDAGLQNVINYLRRSKEIVCIFPFCVIYFTFQIWYYIEAYVFLPFHTVSFSDYHLLKTGRNRNIFVETGKAATAISSRLSISVVAGFLCIYWLALAVVMSILKYSSTLSIKKKFHQLSIWDIFFF